MQAQPGFDDEVEDTPIGISSSFLFLTGLGIATIILRKNDGKE